MIFVDWFKRVWSERTVKIVGVEVFRRILDGSSNNPCRHCGIRFHQPARWRGGLQIPHCPNCGTPEYLVQATKETT